MVAISRVEPARGRAGDVVTFYGSGFTSNPVDIGAMFAGITVPGGPESGTATETSVAFTVPAGIPEDQLIDCSLQRADTLAADSISWFAKLAAADMPAVSVPGQVPGPLEARDLTVSVVDVPQAQDHERLATLLEYVLREIVSREGDLLTFDGSNHVGLPVGAARQAIAARASEATGLAYTRPTKRLTLQWGKLIDGGGAVGPMVANGDATENSITAGNHGVPFDGEIDVVNVLVVNGGILDQVIIRVNGGTVYDSGIGLAIGQDGVHTATPAAPVQKGDRVELEALRSGGADLATIGRLRLTQQDLAEAADAVLVEDLVEAVLIGVQLAQAADQIAVADTAAVAVS